MKRIILTALLFLFSIQFSEAQIVSLDTTFGVNGKIQSRFPGWQTGILATKLQNDGKIVVCGFRANFTSFDEPDTILGRYNANGTLDTSFGINGFVIINYLFIDGTAPNRLLIQPDGKIVLTGAKTVNGNHDFHTYRFNSDGTPDTAFGTNGVVVTDINASDDQATTVLLQADNKLVVLGTYDNNTTIDANYLCGVRYNADGSIDTGFGTDGKAMFGSLAANYSNQLMDAFLETNGKIVMGARHDINGDQGNFVIAKFNANGTIDTGFGTNGARITNFGADDILMSIEKINGKYYAFGYSQTGEDESQIAISRYSTAGALDSTFGTNGKVLLHRSATATLDLLADAKLSGDKILCVGYGESPSQPFNVDALLLRLNLDGSLDTTFNNTGYVLADFSGNKTDMFITLEVQTDGKILAQGSATVSTDDSFVLARYQSAQLETRDLEATYFKVYPNPFSESITIQSKNGNRINAVAELFDISGRKLSEYELVGSSGTIQLDENLPKGNYLLKINSEENSETIKIIKQ